MKEGDRVTWCGASRTYHGTIYGTHPIGWKVRLDNGKYIIANEESLHYEDKREP